MLDLVLHDEPDWSDALEKSLVKKPVDVARDVRRVVSESARIFVPGSDEPAIVFVRDAFDPSEAVALKRAVARAKFVTTKRGEEKIYANGKGASSASKVFGYSPRYPLRKSDVCRPAAWAREDREAHALVCSFGPKLSAMLADHNPAMHARQAAMVERVLPQWRIRDSLFTSGIANKNNPLPYHFDADNFEGAWSAMIVLQNDAQGGRLVVPRWRTAFEFDGCSALFFDGQSLLHGVEPIRLTSSLSYRYSIVYYALRRMCECMSPVEELERAKLIKSDREQARVDREEVLRRHEKSQGKKR